MPFAVELFFDPAAEQRVRDVWMELARAKVNSFMIDGQYRPHLTLGVLNEYASPAFENEFQRYTEKLEKISLKLDCLGIFPRPEGVVYLGAVVTDQLLSVHREFQNRFANLMTGVRPYYLPGNWIPHCTLAYGLSMEAIPTAIEVCSRVTFPISATVAEISLVEVPKHREVLTHVLQN